MPPLLKLSSSQLFKTRLHPYLSCCLLLMTFLFSPWSIALPLEGPLKQGGLITGKVAPGSQVNFDGKTLRLSASGAFVFGVGRDAALSQVLEVTSPSGVKEQHTFNLEKREYNIQKVNGISKKIMSPSETDLKRIGAEAVLVKKARAADSPRLDVFAGFVWPLDGPVTGVYGSQRVYNGKPGRPHFGLDIAAPTGTPVRAPANGVVALVHNDMFYSGGTLILDHGFGVSSTFIHMSKVLAKEGQEIKQGEVIGEVGATGRATGSHLDWRINWFDVRLDPQLLLPARPTP